MNFPCLKVKLPFNAESQVQIFWIIFRNPVQTVFSIRNPEKIKTEKIKQNYALIHHLNVKERKLMAIKYI